MPSEIPQPPGVPLLGNVFDINPNETWNSLNKLAKEYGKLRLLIAIGIMHTHLLLVHRPYLQNQCLGHSDRVHRQCCPSR